MSVQEALLRAPVFASFRRDRLPNGMPKLLRMRNWSLPGVVTLLSVFSLCLFAALPQPAAAKGLFESIFGFLGSTPNPSSVPREVRRPRPAAPVLRDSANEHRNNPYSSRAPQRSYVSPGRGGRYKTMCVRLCDGYYFPISHSSRRRDFYRDAQQCQSQCDSATSLFHMSPSSGKIDRAIDQRGLAYEKLRTAFLYRKTLKKDCTCRAKPWSVSERIRHQNYELKAQGKTLLADPELADLSGPDADQTETKTAALDKDDEASIVAPVPAPAARREPRGQPQIEWYQAPTPARAVRRKYETYEVQQIYRAPAPKRAYRPSKPTKPKSSGIAGLPPVRYRHNWSASTN